MSNISMFYYTRRILFIVLNNLGFWSRFGLTLRYSTFILVIYSLCFLIGYPVLRYIEIHSANEKIRNRDLSETGAVFAMAPMCGLLFIGVFILVSSAIIQFLYWLWTGGCCCNDIEDYYNRRNAVNVQYVNFT